MVVMVKKYNFLAKIRSPCHTQQIDYNNNRKSIVFATKATNDATNDARTLKIISAAIMEDKIHAT